MKRLLLTVLAMACIVAAWAWKPTFIGHRGSYKGVMNTVEAYTNGVDVYGYQGLECDVRVTLDGYYVISHDETTNAVGGNLTVASATLAELQAEEYTQTRGGVTYTGHICTVAEYLDICKEKNVTPVIELKWTTGINNNDMSKFPGLAALIDEKGLTDKAYILTSMRSSLEYVRTNFPDLKCQFLCNSNWETYFDWIVRWNLMPSIEAGCFDQYTVKRFHDKGLEVAVWTVNAAANYNKYGEMGVSMMTCDYLMPSEMPELEPINWDAIVEPVSALSIKVDTLFAYTRFRGNLPANFPSGFADHNSPYKSAQQAAITADGTFYTNDYQTSKLVILKPDGTLSEAPGTNSHGICFDSAGNLIQRKDGLTKNPSKIIIYPGGDINATPIEVEFETLEEGQTNFINAVGDVMSEEGGIVYLYQNGLSYVTLLNFANGEFQDAEATNTVSFPSSTAGMIFPIGDNPFHFIYQVRNKGYYLFNQTDKGAYVAGTLNTTPPNSNSSVGGAYFTLDGHEMFLYTSGINYNGGFSIRDMSANAEAVATIPPLGAAGYYANLSTGSFFRVEPVNSKCVIVYNYTMGNGYAAYRVSTTDYAPHTITVAECENGTVEADKTEALEGEVVTLTIQPSEGYQLETLTVTAEGMDDPVVVEDNQFEMPNADVTITATFAPIPAESVITFDAAPENGAVAVFVGEESIESGATVIEGTEVKVVLTPAEGYVVSTFAVATAEPEVPTGMPRRAPVPFNEGENNTYTFEMPAEPVTITAEFEEEVSTAIRDLSAAGDGSVRYIDPMGRVSDRPFKGVNIVVKDGKVSKMVK